MSASPPFQALSPAPTLHSKKLPPSPPPPPPPPPPPMPRTPAATRRSKLTRHLPNRTPLSRTPNETTTELKASNRPIVTPLSPKPSQWLQPFTRPTDVSGVQSSKDNVVPFQVPAAPVRPPRWSLATPRTEVRELSPTPLRASSARAPRLSRRLFSESHDSDRLQMHIPGSQSLFAARPSQSDIQGLTSSILASHSNQFSLPALEPLPSEDPVLTHTSWLDFVHPISQPHHVTGAANIVDSLSNSGAQELCKDNDHVRRKLELSVEAYIPSTRKVNSGSSADVHQSQGVEHFDSDPNPTLLFEEKFNHLQTISQKATNTGLPVQPVENSPPIEGLGVVGHSTGRLIVENEPQKVTNSCPVKLTCEKASTHPSRNSSDTTTVHVLDAAQAQKSEFVHDTLTGSLKEQDCNQEGEELVSGNVEATTKTAQVEKAIEVTSAEPCSTNLPCEQVSRRAGCKRKYVQLTSEVCASKSFSNDEKRKSRHLQVVKSKTNQIRSDGKKMANKSVTSDVISVVENENDAVDSSGGQSSGARKKSRKRRMSEVLRLQKSLATASWTDSVAVEKQTTEIPISKEPDEQALHSK